MLSLLVKGGGDVRTPSGNELDHRARDRFTCRFSAVL
ncbi:hypothetical protein DFQ14_12423 [Halopolyspora algeriensis]|uniref:Uncharacterized protein n=1 Tax=Halopolyspora algeriensis TaxID=1500506 RepID=A0A368VD79_9ACTN|nr:hypothetical protein DFQ14_12423 [Halopolyspora algeriensis]TQM56537.1 hypothetical protein FHU43_1336 [Halopolyspora algeriensis]